MRVRRTGSSLARGMTESLGAETERFAHPPPVALELLHECDLVDRYSGGKQSVEPLPDPLAGRSWVVPARLRERRVRRRIEPLLAVRRELREEAPEGAHHPAQGLLRRGSRVHRAALVPLLEPPELELEGLVGSEERPQRLSMALPPRPPGQRDRAGSARAGCSQVGA